jgi:hypothetical protein
MENEIVTAEPMAENAGERSLAMYHEAEERAKLMNVLVPSLLKATHSGDIIDQGGKPFIADSGCEKIARVAGVSFGRPEVSSGFDEDENGKRYFSVTIRGYASILGQEIYEVGGCDEFDKFIASRKLPFGQRKLEVEKKAFCNWRGRCVRTLLGMTGLRWVDLEKYGITSEGRTKVAYKEGSKSHADGGKAEATSSEFEDVRQKIRAQILANLDNNEDDAKEALVRLTSFTDKESGKEVRGRENVSQLSEKWAFGLWAKIKPGGKDRENYENVIMEIVAARKAVAK